MYWEGKQGRTKKNKKEHRHKATNSDGRCNSHGETKRLTRGGGFFMLTGGNDADAILLKNPEGGKSREQSIMKKEVIGRSTWS